jgi:predicted nicotinamide N-methyase
MTLWPGALMLARIVETQDLRDQVVVELGAGAGLVSMVASLKGKGRDA